MNIKSIVFGGIACLLLAVNVFAQTQIKPGRAINITITGVPGTEKPIIDGTYPVSASGMINMPYIGEVRAAGMQADQLARILQSQYKSREIYTNPTIQVLTSSADTLDEQMVHVGGQVRRTGPVKYTQGLTLYQAVQAAGGSTEFGQMKRVKLFRDGKQRQIDLTQAQFMNVPLEPNDTIEVPQKKFYE